MAKTLYDKIWDDHLIETQEDGTSLLYIDRHLIHEVTSAQAFEGLRMTGRKVHSPDKTLAVVDHNISTAKDRTGAGRYMNEESINQIDALTNNTKEFGIEYYSETDKRQGVVHIIGPEICRDDSLTTEWKTG